jgi:hypothetical protein
VLPDGVVCFVHIVPVVATTTDHRVGAGAAVDVVVAAVVDSIDRTAGEPVVQRIAIDEVVARVADADYRGPGQDQLLDVVLEHVVDRGIDRVEARARTGLLNRVV